MTYENVKRLHKAYLECGADAPRLDLERWYPELAVKPEPKPQALLEYKPEPKPKPKAKSRGKR